MALREVETSLANFYHAEALRADRVKNSVGYLFFLLLRSHRCACFDYLLALIDVFNKNGPIRIHYLRVCKDGGYGVFLPV